MKVPRELVGRVIGAQGSNIQVRACQQAVSAVAPPPTRPNQLDAFPIQMIVDKTGVNRVSIDAESPEKKGDAGLVYFIFHGIGSNLLDAKMAISLLVGAAVAASIVVDC